MNESNAQERVERVIPIRQEIINEYQENQRVNRHNFSPEVHLLVGKVVPVVTADSLGGSCANRHHT